MPDQLADEALTQARLDALAAGLDVRVELTDNQAQLKRDGTSLGADSGSIHTIAVTLTNNSDVALPRVGWRLHLPSIQRLLAIDHDHLELIHLTGDAHLLAPHRGFAGIEPGQRLDVTIVGETYVVQQSEFLPRWYLTYGDLEPRVIASTDGDAYPTFLVPFADRHFSAKPQDRTVRVTPAVRYSRNQAATANAISEVLRVIPRPVDPIAIEGAPISVGEGFAITPCPQGVPDAMRQWWSDRAALLGLKFAVDAPGQAGLDPSAALVSVEVALDPSRLPGRVRRAEGYRLKIDDDGVRIWAIDPAGANYAVMTLLGLLPVAGPDRTLPQALIDDAPRYAHRALMLDIARNMRSCDYLKRLIDQLSVYKLNILHLHLTDDEGWRLEIPGLPELTDVGARRAHTLDERDHLMPQLGSGPGDDNAGSGFLTRAEYIDLVQYAAARAVTILPEVNTPGHCRAAVMSMESRYERMCADGAPERDAAEYRLTDPNDSSQLLTKQHYGRFGMLNPGVDGSDRFVHHVIAQVKAMHDEAGVPLRAWHQGGDEVRNILLDAGYCDYRSPRPGCGIIDQIDQDYPWRRSPEAERLVTERGFRDVRDLPPYFASKISETLSRLGLDTLYVWHDLLQFATATTRHPSRIVSDVWKPLSLNGIEVIVRQQGLGFDVVGCAPDFVYFDGPYEASPCEPGTTWATRWLDERIAFSYAPDNPPQVAATSVGRFGSQYTKASPGPMRKMLGIQAHLFSETTRTDEQADYLLFPRLLAFAERAWHRASWELDYRVGASFGPGGNTDIDRAAQQQDYADFAALVGRRELAKLDAAGTKYRVPPPGARVLVSGLVEFNTAFPGLDVAVTEDGGETWLTVEADSEVKASPSLHAATISADGRRLSRWIQVESGDIND